jgi:tRNA (cytidine/uridine-2'-O-)-methyltransferase
MENRYLRRAGLDYWHLLDVTCYSDIEAFFETNKHGSFFFVTRYGKRIYDEINFQGRVYFIFGKETAGLPDSLTTRYPDACLRIPMRPEARSLNLSNAVALVLYEAYRQNGFPALQ